MLCDFGGTMLDDDGVGLLLRHHPVRVHRRAARRARRGVRGAAARPSRRRWPPRAVGTPCEEVDAAARRHHHRRRLRRHFIHRTGHGIGVEEHEDPYIVAGNGTPLVAGHAFSIEPGIYVPGRFGFRLEDIVVAADDGPDPLNPADHDLVSSTSDHRRLRRPPGPVIDHPLLDRMIRLDAATVLLQWAIGGLFFLWVTTRRREVGLGYGWLLRGVYGLMALGRRRRRPS